MSDSPARSQLPFLVLNRMLDNLLSREISQDTQRMTAAEEEEHYRQLGRKKLIDLSDQVFKNCEI